MAGLLTRDGGFQPPSQKKQKDSKLNNLSELTKADKPIQSITFARTCFAILTRKTELIEQHLLETERVQAREKLRQTDSLDGNYR